MLAIRSNIKNVPSLATLLWLYSSGRQGLAFFLHGFLLTPLLLSSLVMTATLTNTSNAGVVPSSRVANLQRSTILTRTQALFRFKSSVSVSRSGSMGKVTVAQLKAIDKALHELRANLTDLEKTLKKESSAPPGVLSVAQACSTIQFLQIRVTRYACHHKSCYPF